MFFCGAEDVAIYTGRAGGLWVPPWESGSEGKHQFTEHMYLEYQSFNRGLEGITVGRKTHGMNETPSHGITTHKAFFQLQR